MAEILQSLDDLETYFADLVTTILGIKLSDVQISYEKKGRPSFGQNDNLVFISVLPEPDEREMYKQRNQKYDPVLDQFTTSQTSQRTIILSLVIYGNKGFSYGAKISNAFYTDDIKISLSKNHLFLVPDHTLGPIRIPEQFNGQWWSRYDLKFRLYNTVNLEYISKSFIDVDIRTEEDL